MAQPPISFFSWLLAKWRRNLRLRHTFLLSGIILLTMGLVSTIMVSVQRSTLHKAAEAKGLAFTQAFALGGWAAIHGNLFRIQEALLEYSQDPDIRGIEVIDKDNMIVAAKIPDQIGLVLEDQEWQAMKQQKREALHYTESSAGEQLLIIVAPLSEKGQIKAWIRVIFSLEDVQREETQLVFHMTVLTMILMGAGIFGVQWAQKQVSGLLQKVNNHLQEALTKLKVSGVNPVTEASQVTASPKRQTLDQGDIEYLGETVTETVDLLKTQSEALRDSTVSLEQKVKDRTADLADLNLKLETATRHKSEFLANMSHELRTPLNAVIGFSEVLKEKMYGPLNGKQEEYVEDIYSSGHHLLSLINDILDLSKIEAGQMDLELSTFDLRTALENALGLVREQANRRGIQLILRVEERIGDVTADERKVKQVLLNLLSNAVKFTLEEGKISVGASLGNGMVKISVSDSGIGIAPADQEEIFEEFRQSKGGEVAKAEGTGLGLMLTRKFVELHGGTIWVESEVGRGSIFTFTLPMRAPMTEAPTAPPAAPTQHQLVLVIEDDQASAKLLSIQLRQEGFSIEVAHDGEEGFDKARALQPAAITLDILMPGVDGWELLSRLKADFRTDRIPVVIVSILDERGMGYSLGAVDYLVKPIAREKLVTSIRRIAQAVALDRQKITVLVVDDDPMVLEYMAAILRPEGFTIRTARGGREGLSLAREWPPNLLVLDLLMPDIDGFQFLDELKRDPLTAGIPIVILTCKTLTPEEKGRLHGRISDLVQKGEFSRGQLVAQLRSLVGLTKSSWQAS